MAARDERGIWKRRRALVGLCVLALLVLAACGDEGAEGTSTTAAGGGEGEGAEIVAWFNGETVPADEFGALAADGVTVSYDIRGDAVLTDMLRMKDAGERLPDLVEIDSHLTPAFMEAGLLAPMTEQVALWEEEDPDLYATIPESVWRDGTYDGEIYHFPNKSLVDALFYNVSMLEEAGAQPPPYDTYWEMLDSARAVQAANPDLPAYFATGGASHDRMFRWLYSFGVPFEGNVPNVNTEQGIEMIDWLQTMFEEGIVDPEFMINQQDEGKGAFVAGELPFIEEGLNGGGGFMLDDFAYGEDWLTVPYPVHEDSGGVYIGVPRGWSMSADAADPYAASLVLRYLSDPEIAAERYFDLESGVVQSIPVLEGEQMGEAQPFFTQELLDIFRGLEAQIPPGTNTNAVGEVLVNMVEELTVTGTDESPEEVAARYQPMFDELR
ncbi:MAG TPA: extracellular solute-binding protein [Acidimicrobiia bacterium]|nr:extracellular solute-binding protein [Acidimicrobiia bacterium]